MPALKSLATYALLAASVLASSAPAAADPTSGVDSALFRSSYDTGGVFALEGARLMTRRDLSFKVLLGGGLTPLKLGIPGIGGAGSGADKVLDYLVTIDLAFGMTVSDRVAIGFDVAGYRTATGAGYGARGHYNLGGQITRPSTGLIALRPLSNIDPSASPNNDQAYLGDGLAGPLDARLGIKVALVQQARLALTAVASVFLPFGEDEMLLGDHNLVFEPKLALDWRKDRSHATRIVGNLAARLRQRSVLESYDASAAMASTDNAQVVLDVGSELVAGVGGMYEVSPRVTLGLEGQLFVPLPDALSWGTCLRYNGGRCDQLTAADYFGDTKHGDFTSLVTAGAQYRLSADVTASVMLGTSLFGARGDEVRVTTGIVWAPQPGGTGMAIGHDRDGDGVPDSIDACPDEAEDKDGFQDEDGCPDLDNDGDGIPDAADECPNEPEDKDGFQDEDGCPDDDNDGDGFADAVDKCPNDPETVNGFEDDDGCPDVRGTSGPEERADRIDLKGAVITFARGQLTAPARQVLAQVATLIKTRRLAIRVEVHVALGTRSANAAQIAAQHKRDKATAQQRAKLIADYLASQGVAPPLAQTVGLGSERPLGTATPTDPINDRVDFIKAQQGATP